MATLQAVMGNLTASDRRILTAVNSGASSLSLLGSGFIVLCYICFKELRKFSFKLVFFLALSDMLYSFFSIVGDPSKGLFCYAQGYSTHFFCVASFLWTTTIAFTLHRTVVRHKTDVEDLEPVFHLYVWGTSLVMTVIRSIGNDHGHFGELGAWCWTQTGRTGKAVHFITFYVPLWGAIIFNGVTYFQVIRMLNNATRMAVGMSNRAYQQDARADMKALNRWGYYPLILIGSWTFGTINRVHDFIEPGHKIYWLSFLDVGMAALMVTRQVSKMSPKELEIQRPAARQRTSLIEGSRPPIAIRTCYRSAFTCKMVNPKIMFQHLFVKFDRSRG